MLRQLKADTVLMTDRERIVVATHEAAHAVLAVYYGYILGSIEIGVDEHSFGHAPFQSVLPDGKTEAQMAATKDVDAIIKLHHQLTVVFLAGPNAQELYCGRPAFDGAGSDLIDAVASAKTIGDLKASSSEDGTTARVFAANFLQQATQKVLLLLSDSLIREAIETVSTYLQQESSLSGEQATEMINCILKR